jgi:hypothetical protein
MSTLKLMQFSGEIPRLLPRLLPDTGAQLAENVRLDDGGLTPMRRKRAVHTVEGIEAKTIYKHGTTWLAWPTIVNAAPGPVAQDRLYYTGDGAPKMRVGAAVYPLALPFPSGALTATLSGSGTGDVITRFYVYTFVTEFGEESEPNPVSNEVNWQVGQTVTLSGFANAPSGRGITKQRIYRSQSSISAGTDFFFIAERNASNANFVDTFAADQFAEVLPSRDWSQPPATMQGLISLPNGMMAASDGKELLFCEPYQPHAWPIKYRLTMDAPIVALGAYGTAIVVATEGQPYIVAGTAPENMQQEKMELNLPCTNARGLVDLGYAVAYPSKDGLVVVSGGTASVATQELMTRNDWLKTAPETFVAGQYSGRYFASFEYLEADGTPIRGTFIFDLTAQTPFILRLSERADAFHYDVGEAALYMLIGSTVYEFDPLGEVNEIMSWHSKEFVYPAPATFGCILIEAGDAKTPEEEAAEAAERQAIQEANQALFAQVSLGGELNGAAYNEQTVNGDGLQRLLPEQYASVEVYADKRLVSAVGAVSRPVRLPAVPSAKLWEVQVHGTMRIEQITLATSPRELNNV